MLFCVVDIFCWSQWLSQHFPPLIYMGWMMTRRWRRFRRADESGGTISTERCGARVGQRAESSPWHGAAHGLPRSASHGGIFDARMTEDNMPVVIGHLKIWRRCLHHVTAEHYSSSNNELARRGDRIRLHTWQDGYSKKNDDGCMRKKKATPPTPNHGPWAKSVVHERMREEMMWKLLVYLSVLPSLFQLLPFLGMSLSSQGINQPIFPSIVEMKHKLYIKSQHHFFVCRNWINGRCYTMEKGYESWQV